LEELIVNPNHLRIEKLAASGILTKLKTLEFGYLGNMLQSGLEERISQDSSSINWNNTGSDASLQAIFPLLLALKSCHKIEVLKIPRLTMGVAEFAKLAQIRTLRKIDLTGSDMTSPNVYALTGLTRLEEFRADGCKIDASALPAFQILRSHSLKRIFINSPTMTAETVALYRRQLPGVSIN